MSPFAHWESFYAILGSAAAALTGLQFVVIALIANINIPSSMREVEEFGTPTIFHFGAVLLLSGILTAPWRGPAWPAVLLAIGGAVGFAYSVLVAHRARKQTGYALVFEDWLFHVALPAAAYGLIAAGAAVVRADPPRAEPALFGIAGAAALLLFAAIHNAWDAVTYIVLIRRDRQDAQNGQGETRSSDPNPTNKNGS